MKKTDTMIGRSGRLFVVSGPSGVGKGTICRALTEKFPEIALSVSVTTREPRKGEAEGVSYFFRTRDEFLQMVESGEMLEYAEVYGNCYGTPLSRVLEVTSSGRSMILEIEMDGAMQVKQKYPDAVFVFVLPPSLDVLLQRIVGRGTESAENIERRTIAAKDEIDRVVDYDFFIINDIIGKSVDTLKMIIDSCTGSKESKPCALLKLKVDIGTNKLIADIKEGKNVATID